MANINYIEKHNKTYAVKRHKHDFWEIIYVTDGGGKIEFSSFYELIYQKGQIICIPPNVEHVNNSDTGFKNIHLTLENWSAPIDQPVLIKHSELTKDFLSLLELAYKYFHRYPIEHPLNYSLSNSIAETLNQILHQKTDFSPVKILHDAISNNFTDVNFCLDDAYLLIPLAKEYARKLFIAEYKTTPLKFLLARRIEFAKQLLSRKSQVNLRINEIAESCGFADPAYFSRIFKKLTGVTPNHYQLKALKENKIF